MIKLSYSPITFWFILIKLYYTQSLKEEKKVEESNNITPAFI